MRAITSRLYANGLNAGMTPPRPTNTRPGTRARIEVYRRRAEMGVPLFVVGDYVDPEFYSRKKISHDISPPANG